MVSLIENSDVMTRLAEIPGLALPTKITPERVQEYIEEASGTVLTQVGLSTPPSTGSVSRDTLDGLCIRLVILMIRSDLFANNAEMAELLRRQRVDLLKECESLQVTPINDTSVFFEVTGPG